ncbi:N-acetylmuramic acid 6-phosphate etherase [Aureimonas mangrovi]|uniref:N-acetylmuramic acid 6-phosphate etherase n=1 Tax=Aureimonas mangrovi TaxID=2758041 RepID=UPI00163DE5FA|nr:N-acetylmuramic acid 6-phosphate etherase [Aureimonas mangrovi]
MKGDVERGKPIGELETESASPRFAGLETWPTGEVLAALLGGQAQAMSAVAAALPQIEAAVEAAAPRLVTGGRLVYVGSGTSGRLGLLDAVELTPTFGWPRERAVAILAGGSAGLSAALEGAEDDDAAGATAIDEAGIGQNDVLIAIAASGRTPFTAAAARRARERGALVVALANNPGAPLFSEAGFPVLLRTGAEVVAGSTRLGAGTAQKIALNLFSTALMVTLGRVSGGRMVSMRATNEKLRQRAGAMLVAMTGCAPQDAENALAECGYDIATALHVVRSDTP